MWSQVIFTLRAVQYPASIPVSLASLDLVRQATTAFSTVISLLLKETSSIAEAFDNVRKLYEIASIPNKVIDGGESFPEDRNALYYGLSIEFRCVSTFLTNIFSLFLEGMSLSSILGVTTLHCVMFPFELNRDSFA